MILKDFYQAMMNRVLEKVPEIQYFEMYNGQPEAEQEEINYNLPAVFFEYAPMEWKSNGNRTQQAECAFSLRLQTETYMESSNIETQEERNAGLDHLRIADEIFLALHGFSGPGFGTISRTNFIPDNDHNESLSTVIPFKTRLTDTIAKPKTERVTASLEITNEFTEPEA